MSDEIIEEELSASVKPLRKRVNIEKGLLVSCAGSTYQISQILDYQSVIGVDVVTGITKPLKVSDLSPVDQNEASVTQKDLAQITDKDWEVAQKRYSAIKPFINDWSLGRKIMAVRAQEVGVNVATLYRWLKIYREFGSVSSLASGKRGWKKGNSRLEKMVTGVIDQAIQDFYLTSQKRITAKVITAVEMGCKNAGLDIPSQSSIRKYINSIPERERLRGRGEKEKAKNKFTPSFGAFPGADYPLAVVQIDHTPVDLILLDDEYRKPINKCWLTLAIDVCTRMVTGYYLSLDPPSGTSVAMCIAQMMLKKEEWLLLHGVEADWPVWGAPAKIHVDNGADFRADHLAQSCLEYGIELEFRPVGQPQYGGHIERLIGTFMLEVHDLPGTTFSNIKERGEYDADKHSVMTKSEFEEWFITLVCKKYHKRKHSALGMPPLKKWELGILGDGNTSGIGLPALPSDRHTVLIDFLPFQRRTIQREGVSYDSAKYYSDVLRRWISSKDIEETHKPRKFIFRRDPRDISCIWFFDPELCEYFKIPFKDVTLPPMSAWEFNQAKRRMTEIGRASEDTDALHAVIVEMREMVDNAAHRTKKARRAAQRRKDHEKSVNPSEPLKNITQETQHSPIAGAGLVEGDIDDFGVID